MRTKISVACFLIANGLVVGSAYAGDVTFDNPNFTVTDPTTHVVSTSLAGWSQGGGSFTTPLSATPGSSPPTYIMDPSSYTTGSPTNTVITSSANDLLVPVSMTYNGKNSVQVNDSNNDRSISTISQTVTNYGMTTGVVRGSTATVNLAWSAVLQSASHPAADTDAFTLKVYDVTTSTVVKLVSYNAATAASLFTTLGSYLYSGWRAESISVTAGDTITVSMLATDCDAGGHFGYVYLSSFGTTPVGGSAPVIVGDGSKPDIVNSNNHTFNLLSNVPAGSSFNNRFDGGTLRVDSAGSSAAAFTITANKGYIDHYGNTGTFSGLIADDTVTPGTHGRLVIANSGSTTSGKVILSNASNSYSGGTEVQSGATLSIANAGAIGTGGLALVGTSTVPAVLETTANMTISAPITVAYDPVFSVASGTTTTVSSPITNGVDLVTGLTVAGDVVVSGGGTLALTAANTYTGLTAVDAGSTLALSGAGSIAPSSALNNNGTVNVTGANGNVALGGTFTQSSTGNLLMNISPTNNQKILVTGAASLAGGLSLAATAGTYTAGKYTLITANGVSGTFGAFSTTLSTYTRLGYALGYDANNVYLYLTPNVGDTQQSLVNTAAALQNTYTLQNSVLANSFYYDCNLFDVNNICVSAGGRNTAIQSANGLNNTSALLIASYRLDENNSRIGAYADQNLSINNGGSTVNLGNNTPLIGLFAAWSQRPDGTGAEVKAGIAYGQKNTTITRQVVGTSESGSGSSQLNSQGAQLTAKYGFGVVGNVIVSPYVGMRYTQNNMGGYSEAASPSVTSPLTYSALNTNATTALAGIGASYRFIPSATVFGSAGVETDTNTANGTYSATGLTGLTPVNFNANPVKTRPTATIGATYDVDKNQRIGVTGIYRQEPFQAVSSTTVMATYTVGL
jgi:autotransporter-associated beta strand protein